jgi:DNA-binding transcriptional ArsR family regulator
VEIGGDEAAQGAAALRRMGPHGSTVIVQYEVMEHPDRDDLELPSVLHALSDPMRLRIVAGLAAGDERTCGSFALPVTKSTCSHHFRVLREAGVIRQEQEGTARLNTLRRDDLDARFPGLLDSVLRAAA